MKTPGSSFTEADSEMIRAPRSARVEHLVPGLGFSMLNQDRLIVTAVHFILRRGNDHAQVQAQWEEPLRSSNRDLGVFSNGLGASLRAMATYAIPALGAVGSAWAFLTLDDAPPALVVLPVVLVVVFLKEVAEVVRAYQRLADVRGSGVGPLTNRPRPTGARRYVRRRSDMTPT